jgi:hypothetical protein
MAVWTMTCIDLGADIVIIARDGFTERAPGMPGAHLRKEGGQRAVLSIARSECRWLSPTCKMPQSKDDGIGQLHGGDDARQLGLFADRLSVQSIGMVRANATRQDLESRLVGVPSESRGNGTLLWRAGHPHRGSTVRYSHTG